MISASSPDLKKFIHAAKKATYAAQGDSASVTPVLPGSKQLEYRDGELLYRDIFLGSLRFVGQEFVYRSERAGSEHAVWSMSYAGGLVAPGSPDAGRIYSFLRKALLKAPVEMPLRGPALFELEGMRYACRWEGTLEQFHGLETVTFDGKVQYELRFGGGNLA